jgi:hypothetical protein
MFRADGFGCPPLYPLLSFTIMENSTLSSAHTPGPWVIAKDDNRFIQTVGRLDIAEVCNPHRPQTEANARLIALAPEMLDELERVYEMRHVFEIAYAVRTQVGQEEWDRLKAVIDKAKGH